MLTKQVLYHLIHSANPDCLLFYFTIPALEKQMILVIMKNKTLLDED
jgi:hypothetical protein